jgi:hypothetical protein
MTDLKVKNPPTDITAYKNTDKEIWRKVKDDYYSPSIHITETGGVGINVGGYVIIMPIEKWHFVAKFYFYMERQVNRYKYITFFKKEVSNV